MGKGLSDWHATAAGPQTALIQYADNYVDRASRYASAGIRAEAWAERGSFFSVCSRSSHKDTAGRGRPNQAYGQG